MRAVIFTEHGGPDVLRTDDVDQPEPAAGESIVRVRACGVEPGLDLRTRQDGAGRDIALPHVLGAALAGEIAGPDPADSTFSLGQPVVANPIISCGRCAYCHRGLDASCDIRQLLGVHRWGGYAELARVPTRNLLPLPATVPFAAAAAIPVSYTTAWHMLTRRAGLQARDRVLVLGAAGPVGIAAAQIAGLHGSQCIVATRSPEKAARLPELVDPAGVVDPSSPSFAEDVTALTDGAGVDLVVDTVGAAMWDTALALLRPEGRLVCCGSPSGGITQIELRRLYRNNVAVLGSTIGTLADTREVVDLVGRDRLRPTVGRTFDLPDAADAHRAMAEGSNVGKIVLLP